MDIIILFWSLAKNLSQGRKSFVLGSNQFFFTFFLLSISHFSSYLPGIKVVGSETPNGIRYSSALIPYDANSISPCSLTAYG